MDRIKNYTVIGAGHMGHEIAETFLMASFHNVVLNDLNMEVLNNAKVKIKNGLKKIQSKGKLGDNITYDKLMKNLTIDPDLKNSVENADFIVEAIPEKMDLKQDLFKALGEYAPEHAILASNTSTMSITKIAQSCAHQENVVGMHFFTPVPLLRLIEVIKGDKTSEETMQTCISIGNALPALKGKRFIARIEKESPGFIVNRLTIASSAYINWLMDYALENNIPFESVDADIGNLQGLGPCSKWDYLGLDTIFNSLKYFENTLHPDFAPGKALAKLVKDGNLGKKTGKGFCEWTDDGYPKVDKRKKAGLFNTDLFMALQLNEGCRLLKEGIVKGYKMIDDTMLAGMDMPGPFGPGKNNYHKWSELLHDFVERSGKKYFLPCDLMKSGNFIKMRK